MKPTHISAITVAALTSAAVFHAQLTRAPTTIEHPGTKEAVPRTSLRHPDGHGFGGDCLVLVSEFVLERPKQQSRCNRSEDRHSRGWFQDDGTRLGTIKTQLGVAVFDLTSSQLGEAQNAFKWLGAVGRSLTEAVNYFLKHALPVGGTRTFTEIAVKFIQHRRSFKDCKARTITQYENYFKVIKKEFSDVDFTETKRADIEDRLGEAEWSPRTRKNFLVTLTTVYEFLRFESFKGDEGWGASLVAGKSCGRRFANRHFQFLTEIAPWIRGRLSVLPADVGLVDFLHFRALFLPVALCPIAFGGLPVAGGCATSRHHDVAQIPPTSSSHADFLDSSGGDQRLWIR